MKENYERRNSAKPKDQQFAKNFGLKCHKKRHKKK